MTTQKIEGLYRTRIPIYGGYLYIIFTDNFLETGRLLGKEFSLDINENCGLANASKDGTSFYIFIKKKHFDNLNTICHESVHIANYIFKTRGVDINVDNDEPQAYLTGWVAQQVDNCRKKFPLKPQKFATKPDLF